MRKKILSMLLCLMMVMSFMPAAAYADDADATPAVIYVDAENGNDENDNVGTSAETAYKNLETAVNAAQSGDTIQLAAGTYTLYNKGADVQNKDLTFVGAGTDATTWLVGPKVPDPAKFGTEYNSDYSFDVRGTEAKETITLKNMTLQSGSVNYLGFAGTDNTVVEDCVIEGKTFYWGNTSAVFKNTTFNCPDGDYAIWTYATPVETFENCTFNGSGKFINVYGDSGINKFDSVVNFKDCTVNDSVGNKPVLNINDSNKGNQKYIVNISGNNTLNGVKTDNISCSRLFGYSGRATNSTGKSIVNIEGTTVWENGQRVAGHNHGIEVDGGYYDNGVSGETDVLYTDGYKDDAFTVQEGDWVTNNNGQRSRTITTICDYCGYTEVITESEIPFTKIVEKSGSAEPSAQSFELEVIENFAGDVDEDYPDVVINAEVDTEGVGEYTGILSITGPTEQVETYLSEFFIVREKNDGAANWTYDDAMWAIVPDDSNTTAAVESFTFYPATGDDNGYSVDLALPYETLAFTNTYSRNSGGGGGGGGVVVSNAYYFAIEKTDAQDDSKLSGATFGLFLDGEEIATATTAESGMAVFRVSASDYSKIDDDSELYYQELTAPEGYVLSSGKHVISKSDLHRNSQRDALAYAENVKNYRQEAPDDLNDEDHVAYVQGYPDGTVKPNNNVTRAETTAMLYRLLTDSRRNEIRTTSNSFSDVNANLWYNEDVSSMTNGNYIFGYPDGTFGGDKRITRAEFVAMLVRFIEAQEEDCSFTDVPESHWAYGSIATATQAGWISGYIDGTFKPDQAITRAEAMTIINRVLNRGVDENSELLSFKQWPDNPSGTWYYYEVIEASNEHEYTGKRPSENWTSLEIQ